MRVSSVLTFFGHNFWVLVDVTDVTDENPFGTDIRQLHGVDRNESEHFDLVGADGDLIFVQTETDVFDNQDKEARITIEGTNKEILDKWNAALDGAKSLNDQNISYRILGIDDAEGTSGNSNTAAYTNGRAMGVTDADLDAGIDNNGVLDPGFGRDFYMELDIPTSQFWNETQGTGGDLGDGDNTVIRSDGSAFIDGGAGIDTVTYEEVTDGVTIDFTVEAQGQNIPGYIATVKKAGGSEDELYNIEKIIGSSESDTVIIDNLATPALQGPTTTFDLGSNELRTSITQSPIGFGDLIDLSQFTSGVTADLRDSQNQWITDESGNMVTFKNAESVIGTGFDDIILSNQQGAFIDAGDGDDQIFSGASGKFSTIFAGAGDDVIEAQGFQTVIHTGAGADKVVFAHAILVTDAIGEDGVYLDGQRLSIATRNSASEAEFSRNLKYSWLATPLSAGTVAPLACGRPSIRHNQPNSL